MPDAYALDDGTILMAGLNTNMSTSTVNIFVRRITTDGDVLGELEIFHISNPDRYSFALETFYDGSTVDNDYVYISAAARDSCVYTMPNYRSQRFVKVDLNMMTVVQDTVICYEGVRIFGDINASLSEDSLYVYGYLGYLNTYPDIILTTMTKDFRTIKHQKLRTVDTHVMPLEVNGDGRAVAGSHYRHQVDPFADEKQDIWYGRIEGDSIVVEGSIDYYAGNVLWKPFILDSSEKAFLGYGLGAAYDESSICLLRNDTLAWCFYDAYAQELSDLIRIGDDYCVLQASYREEDDRIDRIVLHYLDQDGLVFGSDSYIARWIRWSHGGLRIGSDYFVFVFISDWDVLDAVTNGEIPLEDARREFTHVFKFSIK